jgi:ABC-type sugar transport system permease subunit
LFRKYLSYEKRKSLIGFLFVTPWIVGFLTFFARPVIQSFLYSVNRVKITTEGPELTFTGLKNYKYAFNVDPDFTRMLLNSTGNMISNTILILMFSMFIAYLINQKFKGRLLARAVFFLPVIITTGVVINIMKGDLVAQRLMSGQQSSALFKVTALQVILIKAGYAPKIIEFITNIVNNVFEISWKSGVQILLFLAGLQSIPGVMYEVSEIEGATKWESFWKITFPLLSPIILLNIIYTIVDSFTDYSNPVIQRIFTLSRELNMEYSSTLSWIYFLVLFLIIGLAYKVINKKVFYIVE